MDRTNKEEFIIGSISLLANHLSSVGDGFVDDITFKQWFMLMMISNMEDGEKSVNDIADFVGSTRQNVKKMLSSLEDKGYVSLDQSARDRRALDVSLTSKGRRKLVQCGKTVAAGTSELFAPLSNKEVDDFITVLQRVGHCLELYTESG